MAKKTLRERICEYLIVDKECRVVDTHGKYIRLRDKLGGFYLVGKNGAMRYSRDGTITKSYGVQFSAGGNLGFVGLEVAAFLESKGF